MLHTQSRTHANSQRYTVRHIGRQTPQVFLTPSPLPHSVCCYPSPVGADTEDQPHDMYLYLHMYVCVFERGREKERGK